MLVVDVENELSAASMVKDSKTYIEIAKFVQAYDTVIQNPNVFLVEIGETPIDIENEVLTWEQFVNIATHCDLGFTPVPTEQQLAMYYSYAMQIGSISKEVKVIASVNDVAEAQKNYYNFIDDTTTKVENQYKKQHLIAESRMKDAIAVDDRLSKLKLKMICFLSAMTLSVALFIVGCIGIFFKLFGDGLSNYIVSAVFIIVGIVAFIILDKFYVNSKYDFLGYQKSTRNIISKSERTSKDEEIMRDKLNKYKEDLKIAKYELSDKNKTFDVGKCIERLREKNKYYKLLLENGEVKSTRRHKAGEFSANSIDNMPLNKNNVDDDRALKSPKDMGYDYLSPEEAEFLRAINKDGIIDTKNGFNKSDVDSYYGKKNRARKEEKSDNEFGTSTNSNKSQTEILKQKEEKQRLDMEQKTIQTQVAEDLKKVNGPGNGGKEAKFEDTSKRSVSEAFDDKRQTNSNSSNETERKSVADRTKTEKEAQQAINQKDQTMDEMLGELDKMLNISEQDKFKDLSESKQKEIQDKVKSGKITKEQAKEIIGEYGPGME